MTYDQALANFLKMLWEREVEHHNEHYPSLKPETFYVDQGRKFDKVVHAGGVYCFILKKTGGIIKPATWKQPEPKQRERGNILAANPLDGTNVWGVDYLDTIKAKAKAEQEQTDPTKEG